MKHLTVPTKKGSIIFILVLLVAVFSFQLFSCTNTNKKADDLVPVTLQTKQTSIGWGYEILTDGKVYIKQPHIPGVAGNKGFKSKRDAEFVGNKALEKLVKEKGKLPAISEAELRQWGIAID